MPKEVIDGKQFSKRPDADIPVVEVSWGLGEETVSIVTTTIDSNGDRDLDSTYVQLSRHAINRTIRALRRARDQAYGADA